MIYDAIELLGGEFYSFAVWTIDNIDEGFCFLEVMAPEIAQFLLSSNIPHHEVDRFEVQLFNVESNGGDCMKYFSEFKGVKDCGFTCAIEPEHYNLALFIW